MSSDELGIKASLILKVGGKQRSQALCLRGLRDGVNPRLKSLISGLPPIFSAFSPNVTKAVSDSFFCLQHGPAPAALGRGVTIGKWMGAPSTLGLQHPAALGTSAHHRHISI